MHRSKTRIYAAALAACTLVALGNVARADSAEAMCEVRKEGETKRGATGPCTFSQRQGYVDIDLRSGDNLSLAPGDKPNHYRDQKGRKVVRTVGADGVHEYKWEGGRKVSVRFVEDSAVPGQHKHAAAAGTPSPPQQACLAAVSNKANNGEVTVLRSESSQGGHVVMIGVGPQRAPWRCRVSGNGAVQDVMFAGSEGRL